MNIFAQLTNSESITVLFFLLVAYLIGLLTGWLLWGSKVKRLLNIIDEKEAMINEWNARYKASQSQLELVTADLKKAQLEIDDLLARIRRLEEEKGQLHANVMDRDNTIVKLNADLKGLISKVDDQHTMILGLKSKNENLNSEVNTMDEIASLQSLYTATKNRLADVETSLKSCQDENDSLKVKISGGGASLPGVQAAFAAAAAVVNPDDLKIVEGIGPKIEQLLNDAGIFTFRQLANTTKEKLRDILDNAGERYRIHDPSTWPKQSELCADAKWEELKEYQDYLIGGKDPTLS
ncbi:MAG: hypothetical protein KA010_03190 [Saprospiraceae bacterium]|nr:hypothetical protein [Saprospiraceae bacterium]